MSTTKRKISYTKETVKEKDKKNEKKTKSNIIFK